MSRAIRLAQIGVLLTVVLIQPSPRSAWAFPWPDMNNLAAA